MAERLRYCIVCGVAIDLHPYEGESDDLPFECGIAARKAELLERAGL